MSRASVDRWFAIPPDLVRGPAGEFLPLAGEANWGVEKFAVDALRGNKRGAGVTVGVIDTGVDATHPLMGNLANAKDFTGSRYGAQDRDGHGTHTTGTVGATDPRIGMAPAVRLVHGKGLGDSGSGAGTWIANAMRWAVDQGASILSMSLGSSGEDTTITGTLRELSQQGVWVVCAAGNSGPNTPDVDWPGRSPWCVSVAALDSSLNPASFTSAGAKIDTAFSGVGIWSLRPGGGYASMSGTSMATPGAAGVLALYRAELLAAGRPVPRVDELRELLRSRSTDAHTPGIDRRTGPGWISPALLALALAPPPPELPG